MISVALFALLAASGQSETARNIQVEIKPVGEPQIAVWLEKKDGTFVDTLMVTRAVGTFGLGNRPGRWDFGGGFAWPYGRREMTLPIWAERRGVKYERLVFQDCRESALGWHEIHSSMEPFYCRPTTQAESEVDSVSCPTARFSSDKGIPLRFIDPEASERCAELVASQPSFSFYPPRNDLSYRDPTRDWSGVMDLQSMNDLDAVSRATPPSGERYAVTYQMPPEFENGEYLVFVEVSQQYDTNEAHDYPYYVDPALRDYGMEHLGQPSVVWSVPLVVDGEPTAGQALGYTGYGSADGQDGQIRPPDTTISDVPGSGAGRLQVQSNNEGQYRVRASIVRDVPCAEPRQVSNLSFLVADWNYAEIGFEALELYDETIASYDIRYREGSGSIKTEEDFVNAVPGPEVMPNETLRDHLVRIDRLQADKTYTIAVRAYNICQQASPLTMMEISTPDREYATVDACFIATAAHGSMNQSSVQTLRRFRDQVLMPSTVGRALVGLYYKISPPLADAIRENELSKAWVRSLLTPIVMAIEFFE